MSELRKQDKDACKVIDSFGGTSAVASMCDITTGAVSQWRWNGIPKPWMRFFETLKNSGANQQSK